jgi:NAD(P)H dehydrogenase (quinone)
VHASQDYFLSTDLLNATEIAATITRVLERSVPALILTPDDMRNLADAGQVPIPEMYDAAYAASALNWLQQTYDGRMDYSAVTTTTVRDLLDREPLHLSEWVRAHRQELVDQLRA